MLAKVGCLQSEGILTLAQCYTWARSENFAPRYFIFVWGRRQCQIAGELFNQYSYKVALFDTCMRIAVPGAGGVALRRGYGLGFTHYGDFASGMGLVYGKALQLSALAFSVITEPRDAPPCSPFASPPPNTSRNSTAWHHRAHQPLTPFWWTEYVCHIAEGLALVAQDRTVSLRKYWVLCQNPYPNKAEVRS